ncbi:ATP--methionine S-adenosyltransferase [Geotalea daltonii FRC-32]|uniref:ATP--methionine S-adenosyltransferase n=1 Tax=Geotalea daltonii (strain DSM 22248 / JCM 15807 / FRC-32) TaxID=316067 RepID=B9LZE7_GEODF|nr:methionine adenosyltransferase [Geotalea daltonii]ACM20700.1 ATP--methionine S-adenosyltransferase [Geotalea daltonii FRC-32]
MIRIEAAKGEAVAAQRVEIVERKGIGHPDYICDAVMDAISVALSQEYLRRFGTILHHNIDKSLLAAGRVEKHFGGGRILQPMEMIIGDRATFRAFGEEVAVGEIAVSAAKRWFIDNLRFVDPDHDLNYRVVLAPGSEELTGIFARPGQTRVSNDTSAAVGYYPLSATEQLVLDLEHYLNSNGFKGDFPDTGEDVKIMGLRQDDSLELTVAMPLLARFIGSEQEYFARKTSIVKAMQEFIATGKYSFKTGIAYNCLDVPGMGLDGIYLSLLGTSAEDADSGQVGRGNRVNGLISMNRPMGTEAAAGKNPVSHVGKIYNFLANHLAREIYQSTDRIQEVYVLLLNRIGTPIDQPQMVSVRLLMEDGLTVDLRNSVEEIIHRNLDRMGDFCLTLARGEFPVC